VKGHRTANPEGNQACLRAIMHLTQKHGKV
jgi:hypothetical protein